MNRKNPKYKLSSIGQRLKYLRNVRDYSQSDFAQLLGIPFSTYKTYELDKVNTPHTLLQTISEKFDDISIQWLISGKESEFSTNMILKDYIDFKYKKEVNLNEITVRLFERFWNEYYTVKDKDIEDFYKNENYTSIIEKRNILKMGEFISLICDFDYNYFLENNIIPYKEFFHFQAMHSINLEWLLFGASFEDEEKMNKEIVSLLKFASPYFKEKLKEKLKEMEKIQSISL